MTTQWTPIPAIRAEALRAADAAAVLHRDVERLDDALDDARVHELAGARGVQVDDVEGLCALRPASAAPARPGRRRTR